MNDSPDQRASGPRGWWQRLRQGLARSSASIGGAIADLVTKRRLDAAVLEELEDVLIRADLGVAAAGRIVDAIRAARRPRPRFPGHAMVPPLTRRHHRSPPERSVPTPRPR